MKNCYDNIRFVLSDRGGRMCFESFDIIDMPECQNTSARLREYLVHRPLAQVDVRRIQSMQRADTPTCIPDVARAVDELKRLFGAPAASDRTPAADGGFLDPAERPQRQRRA